VIAHPVAIPNHSGELRVRGWVYVYAVGDHEKDRAK
jgi:hypothetical protein